MKTCAVLALGCLFGGPAGATEGPEPPPIQRTEGRTYYSDLVETTLPSYTSSLLSVPNGTDWMAGKTVHDVAMAVQDSDPGRIVGSGPVVLGYDPPDGPRRIRLDFAEGYIRYTNRNRSFQPTSPCTAVSESEAENTLVSTAGAMGVPTTEWGARRVDTVMDRSVDGESGGPPESTCEVERMVTMMRKAQNGVPIFDSKVRETVSNRHERARLTIDWPRFVLQSGLSMRARASVVDEIAQRIWEEERDSRGLGALVHLDVEIGYGWTDLGYVPVARTTFRDIYDRFAGEVFDVALAQTPSSTDPTETLATLQFRARVDPSVGRALLEFFLPRAGTVRLTVVDVSGREVATLADGSFPTGWHQVSWELRSGDGARVPSGVYFARLHAGREAPVRKLIVVQ